MRRLGRWAAAAEDGLVAILGTGALILAGLAALNRYLLPGIAPAWSHEMTTYLVIWAVFIGAGSLVARNGHVRSDMLIVRLSPRGQRWCEIVTCAIAIACMSIFLIGGIAIVQDAINWDERSASSIRFPMWLYYLALPVGSALMLIYYAVRLARCFVDPDLAIIDEQASRDPS